MVMDKHVCPYGTKSKWLLQQAGYQVEDHHLVTRAETDAFKEQHGVKTTPQTFIDGERIGGYEALRKFLGKSIRDPDETSYRPVLAVFAVAAALAISLSIGLLDGLGVRTIEWFVALSMGMLAMLKLQPFSGRSTPPVSIPRTAWRKVSR